MKCQSMFPFRRNGPKKRGKGGGGGGGGRRHHDNGGGGGGRRVPGSAAELLPMMQPTTKALAQMLGGQHQDVGSAGARAQRFGPGEPDGRGAASRPFVAQGAGAVLRAAGGAQAHHRRCRGGGLVRRRASRRPGRHRRWTRIACARWRCAWPPPSRHRRCRWRRCAATSDDEAPIRPTCRSGYTLSRSRPSSDEPAAPTEASGTGPAASACG